MIALILLLVLIAVVLGIIGFVIKGLFWLFVIACVLFVLTMLGSGFAHGRRGSRISR